MKSKPFNVGDWGRLLGISLRNNKGPKNTLKWEIFLKFSCSVTSFLFWIVEFGHPKCKEIMVSSALMKVPNFFLSIGVHLQISRQVANGSLSYLVETTCSVGAQSKVTNVKTIHSFICGYPHFSKENLLQFLLFETIFLIPATLQPLN